jgi:hypothetical protein
MRVGKVGKSFSHGNPVRCRDTIIVRKSDRRAAGALDREVARGREPERTLSYMVE